MRAVLQSLWVEQWVLPAMVFWPLVAAVFVRLIGRDPASGAVPGSIAGTADRVRMDGRSARGLTLAAMAIEGVLGIALWLAYDAERTGWRASVSWPWLSDLGASFSVGVDGLSLPMVVLTAVLVPLAFLGSWNNVRTQTASFGAAALLVTSGIVGIFVSLDLLLFYLSWELMLIPMYFLIGVWGTGARERASLRYVLFNLVGSLLMLVAIASLWQQGGRTSFHIDHLRGVQLSSGSQLLMFGAFFLAFAVKSALVPMHSWLPDAQASAPTFAAVIVGLKVGTYAIMRFAIPLFPAAVMDSRIRTAVSVLSVITIVYGALLAMAQRDLKRLITYSSISHLGFIMLGAFALTEQSEQGAILIMVNHGITTGALFVMAGMLQDRYGTTDMAAFGGLARALPAFGSVMTLAVLSTIGLPGTFGFVGEFLVLVGSFTPHPVLSVIATSGVVLAAVYGLRALQSVLFGAARTDSFVVADLTPREAMVLGVFAVAILWLGVAPGGLVRRVEPAARAVVEAVNSAARSTAMTNDGQGTRP